MDFSTNQFVRYNLNTMPRKTKRITFFFGKVFQMLLILVVQQTETLLFGKVRIRLTYFTPMILDPAFPKHSKSKNW